MEELPAGWASAPLGDVCGVLDSMRVPVNAAEREQRPGSVPYYGATGQVGWIDDYLFNEELVLLGEDGAPFLQAGQSKAYLIAGRAWVNNHAHVLRAHKGVLNKFLLHQLNAIDYHGYVSGTTRLKLPQAPMRHIPLRIAPTPEQSRIVAAIEEHLSRLDAAVAGLKRVQAQLPRYRAAVLKTAVEGRLVTAESESARAEGRQADTAQHWLDQLGLPNVVTERLAGPPGWLLVPLMSLVRESSYGTSEKCEYDGAGPPVLRIPNIAGGLLDLSDLKRGHGASTQRQGSELAPGDLLVVRTNGSRNLIGRAAVITTKFAAPHFFASYLIRLRLVGDQLLWRWIALWWGSPQARALLESLAATTAGQYNISLGKLDQLSVPLPPRAEAVRILEELDRLMSLASAGSEVSLAATRAKRLRQSILRRAFEGELVPQDPNDEPAGVLLERIRAARVAAPIKPGRPRRAGAR